ncbi:MAG TPA: PhoH family protein [Oscillatoriaceae cyanobacterium]
MKTEIRIPLPDRHAAQWLAGLNDQNLLLLEDTLELSAHLAGEALVLDGDAERVALAEKAIAQLLPLAEEGESLTVPQLRYVIEALSADPAAPITELFDQVITRSQRGKPVKARTLTQREYVSAMLTHTLTFGLGPAGTGKTFLAAAMAVHFLKEKAVSRIILTRPAVEAGESLGFLPGDFQAKVDPYFRPLYDAMYDLLDAERFTKYLERGMIEVAPLAYMRGRTLNDAFIILDEAQNTTPEQMKMFLTRIGFGSRVVVTGDATQVDLPRGKRSALQDMARLLAGVPDIAFVRFGEQDVVRHDLVRRIVKAYEAWERKAPE